MTLKRLLFLSAMVVFGLTTGFSQKWGTDLDQALAQANKENKHVLLFFTGSDWCPPCKRMKADIYSSQVFSNFANKELILVMADFPRRPENKLSESLAKKNYVLAERFGARSFPTSVILDKKGKELQRWVGLPRETADTFVEKLGSYTK
jgi:thioredoxin-related protein